MALSCYCDYDAPSVYNSRTVRARKQYRCEECSVAINPGDVHEYAFGVSDGWPYTARTCIHCVGVRQFVSINIPCFCWAHGNLHEDIQNIVEAAYWEAPEEVRGLRFGIGRRIIAAKRARAAA